MSQQYPPPPPPEEGGYPGLGSMPAPGQPPAAAPVARPASIATAVKLMYVGALLSLVSGITAFTMTDAIREQVEKAAADAGTDMTATEIDGLVAITLGVGIVTGLVGAGLWLLMAWANGKGRSWARIVATVLFALSALSFLLGLVQGTQPAAALALSVVTTLVGAVVVLLLWKKESSAYYRAQSAPRY